MNGPAVRIGFGWSESQGLTLSTHPVALSANGHEISVHENVGLNSNGH